MPMDSLRNTQEGGFKIELASPDDVLRLQEIIRACWLDTYPNEAAGITREDIAGRDFFTGDNVEALEYREERMRTMIEDSENEHTWVVKNEKNEIVGFCRLHKSTGNEYAKKVDPYAEIDKIFILKDSRGKGLGKKLMQEAEQWTKGLDIRLEVVAYNDDAINFYRKEGFVPLEKDESIFPPDTRGLPSGKKLPKMEMAKYDIQSIRQRAEQEASMSDWGLSKYAEVLDLNIDEMKGKLVLDIGSGTSEKFAKEASKVEIKVVSISPRAKDDTPSGTPLSVTGRVQEMPFRDNFFDYEVALFSVPYYLPLTKAEYTACFKEVIRTLKSGGKAYFSPVFKNKTVGEGFVPKEFIDEVLSQFSNSVSYTLEKLNPTDQEYRLVLTKKA